MLVAVADIFEGRFWNGLMVDAFFPKGFFFLSVRREGGGQKDDKARDRENGGGTFFHFLGLDQKGNTQDLQDDEVCVI